MKISKTWREITSARCRYPQSETLSVFENDNEYFITLPEIKEIHNVIVLEYK